MQKYANLVELEKCCRTHIFLQNFVLIQPRTSPLKICKILQNLPILLTVPDRSYPEARGGGTGEPRAFGGRFLRKLARTAPSANPALRQCRLQVCSVRRFVRSSTTVEPYTVGNVRVGGACCRESFLFFRSVLIGCSFVRKTMQKHIQFGSIREGGWNFSKNVLRGTVNRARFDGVCPFLNGNQGQIGGGGEKNIIRYV